MPLFVRCCVSVTCSSPSLKSTLRVSVFRSPYKSLAVPAAVVVLDTSSKGKTFVKKSILSRSPTVNPIPPTSRTAACKLRSESDQKQKQ